MPDIRVSSWDELNDALFSVSWNEEFRRYGSSLTFRGAANAAFDLKTSLMRFRGDYLELEKSLLRSFRKYAQRDAVAGDSVWNWLAVAQHHGLPTRLLDWTFSPFVAMHFATDQLQHMNTDGAIWCVDFIKAKDHLPEKMRGVLEREGAVTFTAEMLHQAASTLEEFETLDQEEFVAFFEPPSLDDRVVNQYALFSVMSSPAAQLDHWLERHPDLFRRIIVPSSLKYDVRDKLDQANITERMLFPGLDGLCQWLRRHCGIGWTV